VGTFSYVFIYLEFKFVPAVKFLLILRA